MTGFPPAVRQIIRERSGGWCELCGLEHATDAHHRRPRGSGGSSRDDTNTASNALALCRGCHSLVENHRNVAKMFGWLVDQGVRPAAQEVLYRREFLYLDDLGNLLGVAA